METGVSTIGETSIRGELISSIVSVICIFISYYLGVSQSKRTRKAEQAQARYTGFYVPFFTKLYAGHMWDRPFSSLGLAARGVFFDMISANLHLLGPDMQRLYPDFYLAILHMMEYEQDKSSYPNAPKEIDTVFRKLESAAIRECRDLSRCLSLTSITYTYEIYLRKERAHRPRRERVKH